MSFLDNLPKIPFLAGKEENVENFFALNIDYGKVTAAVWTVYQNKLHILNTAVSEYPYKGEFDTDESIETLIEAANLSLDEALADIMPEPTKLLFGVPDSWLEDENISSEYLKVLKKMVKELGVEPMAYVSTTHAIAHLLQKHQGVPLSAVLVNASDPLIVTVVKGGKTLVSRQQPRGKDISSEVEKALAALTEIEVFPSRILVYGQEKVKDDLASHPWTEQLPFLHLPRVEELPMEAMTQAICFAGASELNPNLDTEIVMLENQPVDSSRVSHALPMDPEEETNLNEAGFVEGDINQRSRRSELKQNLSEGPETAEPIDNSKQDYVDLPPEDEEFLEQEEWIEPQPERRLSTRGEHQDLKSGLAASLAGFLAIPMALIKRGEGELAPPNVKSGGIPALLFNRMILIPVVVLIALIAFYLLVPRAQVVVFVDMKPLENSTQIIADPSLNAIDEASNRIPGKIIETDISGTGDGQATGTKQVGDPAKGKVVIYNATSNNLTLSQGTTLSTSDGKKFTLDTSVQVASKSASAADPPTHSDPASATATQIGPDGNISAGTNLTVGNYNQADVVGKVDTAFSGGVSKDVQVVTAADQQKLLVQVTSDLKQKAQNELQGKLSGDMKILQESFSENITKKTFSKNVGDESSKFSLTINAHYKGTSYSDADLKTLASKLVQTKVPDSEHYTLDASQAEVQAEVANVSKDGKLTFNAKFKAKLMPKLDLEKLKGMITGKPVDRAVQILKDNEQQIIGANIKLSPSLPGPFQRLPLRKQNISIELTAK